MASHVYFTSMRTKYGKNLYDKLSLLLKKVELGGVVKERDYVAIKMHWGEKGNLGYVRPQLVRLIVEKVKRAGGKPFITDANTLYRGSRHNAVDNILTAIANGFAPEVVGAPIIVADGLCGRDFARVKIEGKHFKEVKIASAIHHAKALVAVSHVKGHPGTGFAGAIKNVGMGSASPSGKQNMHSDVKPAADPKKCIACGSCLEVCPAEAIARGEEDKSVIDLKKCIGCGECVTVCPVEAIGVSWQSDYNIMQEKMVEYFCGVVRRKKGKCVYVNFITDVSPDCDCCNWTDASIVPDIGIAASTDPVAVDQASLDLVNRAPANPNSILAEKPDGENKFAAVHKGVGGEHVLEYAEEMGAGTREYKLIEVG